MNFARVAKSFDFNINHYVSCWCCWKTAGEVVTREEIRDRVWQGASIQDVDNSLRVAVNKLRQALGDDPENPVYIETLPRRGYRWLYPVSVEDSEQDAGERGDEPEARKQIGHRRNGAATDYSQPAKPTKAALQMESGSITRRFAATRRTSGSCGLMTAPPNR